MAHRSPWRTVLLLAGRTDCHQGYCTKCARLAEKALKTHVETTEVSEKIYSYVVFCSYQLKGNLKLIRELEGELARYKEKHQAARGAKRALRHAGPMIRLLVH